MSTILYILVRMHPTASHPTASHPTASHPTASHPTPSHPTASHPTAAHLQKTLILKNEHENEIYTYIQ